MSNECPWVMWHKGLVIARLDWYNLRRLISEKESYISEIRYKKYIYYWLSTLNVATIKPIESILYHQASPMYVRDAINDFITNGPYFDMDLQSYIYDLFLGGIKNG